MSVNKEEQLKSLLDGCDYVVIDIVNARRNVKGETSSPKVRLVAGIPENDRIIAKLRDALC